MPARQKDIYLVIGGNGFLGRHIVQQLLDRGDSVSVFDIVQRYDDVPFYSGDICDESAVARSLRESGATCIIHTASPPHGLNAAIYYKVNVQGTKTVIAAAQSLGIPKLIFTSSAGLVFSGNSLVDTDERMPVPEVHMDGYNESKALAEEAVLGANGKKGLWTVALRPAGIFGPGDKQVMHGIYQVYKKGQTNIQIGDNNNILDYTYVGNVAHAHLLAADKLVPPPSSIQSDHEQEDWKSDTPTLTEEELDLLNYPLPPINLSTGVYRVPTSEARPLGPYVTRPGNADRIEAAFADTSINKRITESSRPVIRSRFDQFSDAALARNSGRSSPLEVAGQVFFITNGEPLYFWDFIRTVWHLLDMNAAKAGKAPRPQKRQWVLRRGVAMVLAAGMERWDAFMGREPGFTRFRVQFSCVNRWHNIEKARRVLGYEPLVGMDEALKKTVEWLYAENNK